MKNVNIFFIVFIKIVSNFNGSYARNCESPLIRQAKLSASSSISEREPSKGVLNGLGAWSPKSSDFGQYLLISFDELQNITYIETQGRAFTQQHVEQYYIEYSNDDLGYTLYKDINGNKRLFKGNSDSDSVKGNYLKTSIIARFIKIFPQSWKGAISLRVELYGCNYEPMTVGFNGMGFVSVDLVGQKIHSPGETIRFRLKTNKADGIILYGKGSQNDILALQLKNNKMVLSIKLGGNSQMTMLTLGSLLDDNLWHDVIIQRAGKKLTFFVDRMVIKETMITDYEILNLNRDLYVGGVPNFNLEGLVARENFTGCIDNLMINNSNIVRKVHDDDGDVTVMNVAYPCVNEPTVPVTFLDRKSFIKLRAYETNRFNLTFDFRTFEKNADLLYHRFTTPGYIKLYLLNGKIIIKVQDRQSSSKLDTMFDKKMNDGNWHRTSLIVQTNHIELIVDHQPSLTERLFDMMTGPEFKLGGSFLGCMRQVMVEGNRIRLHPSSISPSSVTSGLQFGSCQMFDRCVPNPCRNGGKCSQTWSDFTCDCAGTGYTKSICAVSSKPLSCDEYRVNNEGKQEAEIDIDIDGSGPMKPFRVKCVFLQNGITETYIGHDREETTEVNGFDGRGSFIQDIQYSGGMEEVSQLVNRSYSCKQYIKYKCYNARLFDFSATNTEFNPYSWWVSRDNKKMDYWGDSQPGTRKCGCGMRADCFSSNSWCNCNGVGDIWKIDEGFIHQKDYLPVSQLHFGDTGSLDDDKKGEFTLGPVICQRDMLFENVVTFRRSDAVIELPFMELGNSLDIYFQFKTTHDSGTFVFGKGLSHEIEVSLLSKTQLQFTCKSNDGWFGISITSLEPLNDNLWHSILVILNRKEVGIIIDGTDTELEFEPMKGYDLNLDSKIFIGTNDALESGYVGCMRSMIINGKRIDLKSMSKEGIYGVTDGCVGKCDSSPCLNNGTCIEGYSSFTCDCQWTAFKGSICADEIGAYIKRGSYIRYDFLTQLNTINEKIRIGFLTTKQKGMLFAITSHSGEYFNLLLSNSGHLRIVFDYGFERQEMIVPDHNLANGQHHDVYIVRDETGKILRVYIDNYDPFEVQFDLVLNQDNQLNELKSVYVGGNESMPTDEMFEGCISRVAFNDFYILNLLYQEDRPKNIRTYPGPIIQNDCEIEPVTLPPDIPETRAPKLADPHTIEYRENELHQASIIFGVVACLLLILLIIVIILICHYVRIQKGEYKTHEDVGSKNAPDADTAILHSQTGHSVKKSHEYFI